MNYIKHLGRCIKDNRKQKELTKQEVVKCLQDNGVSMDIKTLDSIEDGIGHISAFKLQAISEILEINPESVFENNKNIDLATIFKENTSLDEKSLKEITNIQEIAESFINQKNI